jgi:hypothetical protein
MKAKTLNSPQHGAPLKSKPRSKMRIALLTITGLAALAAVGLAVIVGVWILWSTPEAPKLNLDSAELRNTIDIDIPMKAAKWQIYQWPTDDGFLPTPDVYTLLVAEIELADPGWYKPDGQLKSMQLKKDAARPWLSDAFKSLMTKAATDNRALADANCGTFNASIKTSGRPVNGFICASQGKVLLYLTLYAPS